jgi:translocator protein
MTQNPMTQHPTTTKNLTLFLPPLSRTSLVYLGFALFLVIAAQLAGSVATMDAIPNWYRALNKPSFNPPNWIFPIVWPILFLLMAISFWRILRVESGGQPRKTAIVIFLGQLVLNVAWSFAFFGARSPIAGLVVIGLLWFSILAMIMAFRRVDPPSAWLQFPYLGWVSFAALLNIAIWRLNG